MSCLHVGRCISVQHINNCTGLCQNLWSNKMVCGDLQHNYVSEKGHLLGHLLVLQLLWVATATHIWLMSNHIVVHLSFRLYGQYNVQSKLWTIFQYAFSGKTNNILDNIFKLRTHWCGLANDLFWFMKSKYCSSCFFLWNSSFLI